MTRVIEECHRHYIPVFQPPGLSDGKEIVGGQRACFRFKKGVRFEPLHLIGEFYFRRIDMRRGQPPNRLIFFQDVDDAPIHQFGNGQLGDLAEGGLIV